MKFTDATSNPFTPLEPAPTNIETFHEIAVSAKKNFPSLYNKLNAPERIFIYFMFRAGLPGNRMLADQLHREANTLTGLFEQIIRSKRKLLDAAPIDEIAKFVDDATTYLVYLWTNHSHYFCRESADHKRTPAMLELHTLTADNLVTVLEALEIGNAAKKIDRLHATIFDETTEPSLVIPGSVEQSAGNLYSHGFTEQDYCNLPADHQKAINAFHYVVEHENERKVGSILYKIDGKFNRELRVSHYWLEEAMLHAQKNPQCFDNHIAKSLEYLLRFLENGDEILFRKHSIEWLKTKSRVDYTFGFIETYMDPKSYRGSFQAEATIKSLDMDKLNAILPSIEAQMPLPDAYKRDNLTDGASVPNASINVQVWGTGEYGPLNSVAAYCLPNYAEIRSDHGSKQIIYETEKSLGTQLNPEKDKLLFRIKEQREWAEEHDPDFQLDRDLWTVQVILHETLGHASGKLAHHTFVQGENLTIGGKTYNVGDTIPVTSENTQQFLAGYDQTLEELRAEVIAMYTSIANYEELAAQGLYKEWPEKLNKSEMIDALIINMAQTGIRRLLTQKVGATSIAGDHARANYTILNYLLDHGGIELVEEKVTVDSNEHTVLGLRVTNQQHVIATITELLKLVQQIKSTGDALAAEELIGTYGTQVRTVEHIKYMKENLQAVVGNLKAHATLYPDFTLIINDLGEIADIQATWPSGIVEQQLRWSDLAMSTEI